MNTAKDVQKILRGLADPAIAEHALRFFKTGKGEYGEGDCFLGIRVPVIRSQLKSFKNLSLTEIVKILKSHYHEERLFALLLLVSQYSLGSVANKDRIYKIYIDNTGYINNWDLVDSSASQIVGAYLEARDRAVLYQLAASDMLWERRIAVIACFYFIRLNDFIDILKLAELLIHDAEDLIHKAIGWMLREVGKRNMDVECHFLNKYYQGMPRVMLRYAIEKFPEKMRQQYLQGIK